MYKIGDVINSKYFGVGKVVKVSDVINEAKLESEIGKYFVNVQFESDNGLGDFLICLIKPDEVIR